MFNHIYSGLNICLPLMSNPYWGPRQCVSNQCASEHILWGFLPGLLRKFNDTTLIVATSLYSCSHDPS